MSGRKYSQIDLTNSIREAISCRLAANAACARAESLVASLTEAAATTVSLQPLAASAEMTLAEVRQQLESMANMFDEQQLAGLTLEQVREQRQRVLELSGKLERIDQQCRAGTNAASLRARLVTVLDLLAKTRDEIEPWLRDVYSSFQEECHSLLTRVDKEIVASGTVGALTNQIDNQVAKFDAHMETVSERQTLDAERRYVANALAQVCTEMAFAPKLLPQAGPLDNLVLEVDTHAYGVIHFELQLDGVIHSESELVENSCCANFTMIEDKLKGLGVLSQFRYEDDDRPVRLRKGEKQLPGTEPAVAMREGQPR